MEFISNYGLFLIKLVSVVIAILVILIVMTGLFARAKGKIKGKLEIQKLNDKYEDYKHIIACESKTKQELKALKKLLKREKKQEGKKRESPNNIFVLTFNGDIKASAVTALREEITAILTNANPKDEVLVRLDSGGGLVNAYGLAASQLQRIKDANMKLVISIDKIAASGGYMMACVADHIIAAPFAVVGSIGVLSQLPNFHRYLQQKSIDFEQITAGEYKRTLNLFAENTPKGREKMQEEVDDTHALFKSFIKNHRNQVDIDRVATGEHWFATRAIDLKLVDELKTSDDYLLAASKNYSIYEVEYKLKKRFGQRMASGAASIYHKLLSPGAQTAGQDYL